MIRCLLLLNVLLLVSSQLTLSTVDFTTGTVNSASDMPINFIGISMEYENIQNYINLTSFQSYQLNAKIKGDWSNLWAPCIKIPKGYKGNCSDYPDPSAITCTRQLSTNQTYFTKIGQYIYNTAYQPYWSISYDYEAHVNITTNNIVKSFIAIVFGYYRASHNIVYHIQMFDYGDQAVALGYRTIFNVTTFKKQIKYYQQTLLYGLFYEGPGVTDNADPSWIAQIPNIFKKTDRHIINGAFTVRCIVFPDPNALNISSLLSDQATKGYLRKRFKVNDTFTFTKFQDNQKVAISDIRITTGLGKDNVTNTFAATLWSIDMIISFALMNPYRIDFWHYMDANNFQGIMGPGPDFTPQPLYYGLLFGSLIRHGGPTISIPSVFPDASSDIIAYGLNNDLELLIVIINKDLNTSKSGIVKVKTGTKDVPLNCIFLDAPNMNAKTGYKIGGYSYIGGNPVPQGSFESTEYYADNEGYYSIPFKHARAAACSGFNANSQFPDPVIKSETTLAFLSALILILLVVL